MPSPERQLRGILFVLLAAGLWGTLGTVYTLGGGWFKLTPLTLVFWRGALATLTLGVALGGVAPLLGKGTSLLRMSRRDFPIFAAWAFLGVTVFFLLYIYSIVLVGVAVAVVLLYTAPVFVALMAWRFLGEGFGARKITALALTFAGCTLVARAYDPSLLSVNLVGIACGIGSGFTYAFYSIFGKILINRGYSTVTMSFYVYGMGAVGLLVVALFLGSGQLLAMGTDLRAWALLLMLGVVQTLGASVAYSSGLRYLEASVASIVATFEPVVAAVLAFFVLHERLEWPQVIGGALIVLAVILLQARRR